jgi:PPOX class probable F420-dependent enzyme
MKPLEQFADQPYLNLDTFRHNGEEMKTPVWFVQDGENLYIRTTADSGKVKSIRKYPRVNISPCKVDGELIGGWCTARGYKVRDNPAIQETVDRLLDVKYGQIKREIACKAARLPRRAVNIPSLRSSLINNRS